MRRVMSSNLGYVGNLFGCLQWQEVWKLRQRNLSPSADRLLRKSVLAVNTPLGRSQGSSFKTHVYLTFSPWMFWFKAVTLKSIPIPFVLHYVSSKHKLCDHPWKRLQFASILSWHVALHGTWDYQTWRRFRFRVLLHLMAWPHFFISGDKRN